jgi:hypothetical protein
VIWDYFENYPRDRLSINERPLRPLNGSIVYENETIPWTLCGEVDGHSLECGSIEVPLDQFNSKFSAGKFGFDISVIRLRGRNAGHGRNLLIHPGNPGDSGIGFLLKHGGPPEHDYRRRASYRLLRHSRLKLAMASGQVLSKE